MAQVTVTINSHNYRMACHDGEEEHLKTLAEQFDENIKNLRDSFGEIGNQRLTIMAGVMAFDEIHELKAQIKALKAELKTEHTAQKKILTQQQKSEHALAEALNKTTQRVEEIIDHLNQQ